MTAVAVSVVITGFFLLQMVQGESCESSKDFGPMVSTGMHSCCRPVTSSKQQQSIRWMMLTYTRVRAHASLRG